MTVLTTFHKAEKYAIRGQTLNNETKQFFHQSFGCVRKVYNLYVAILYNALETMNYQGGDVLPAIKLPEVTDFKSQYDYLKIVDSLALANAKIAFEAAVKRYNKEYDHVSYTKSALRRAKEGTEPLSFRGLKGMPKFHARSRGYNSYKTNCQYGTNKAGDRTATIKLVKNRLYLPKLKESIELIIHRPLPSNAVIGNVTISMDAENKYFAAIEYSYQCEMDLSLRNAALKHDESIIKQLRFLGLDYSQPNFYVDSEGRIANYPHYYKKSEMKLARMQRRLSHMQGGKEGTENSKNYEKQKKRIKKMHVKIKNQRRDFINKEAKKLSDQYDVIVVEDLDLRSMGSALNLGKNLHDNGFGMFRVKLSEKLEQKGSVLVKIDKWYPSTKTCSCCGYVNTDVTLGISTWICPQCKTEHMRDVNAAVNIREEGKREFLDYFKLWLLEDKKSKDRAAALSAARKKKREKAA